MLFEISPDPMFNTAHHGRSVPLQVLRACGRASLGGLSPCGGAVVHCGEFFLWLRIPWAIGTGRTGLALIVARAPQIVVLELFVKLLQTARRPFLGEREDHLYDSILQPPHITRHTMFGFGAFRATNPLSSGLLWYVKDTMASL
jgi:hypothetical protein